VCWFGLPVSILISIILISLKVSHIDIEKERKDLPLDIFYSVCASCLSVVGQIFLNISLRYEDATKIAITKTIDVFFSFILQYILLNIAIDLLGLLGACSILTGTFFVLIFKLLENKYQTYLKHKNAENSDLTVTSPVSNGESSPKVELKKIKKSKRAVFLKIIFFKI
jgi:drug/metabolite transporter (DMT)-like permease